MFHDVTTFSPFRVVTPLPPLICVIFVNPPVGLGDPDVVPLNPLMLEPVRVVFTLVVYGDRSSVLMPPGPPSMIPEIVWPSLKVKVSSALLPVRFWILLKVKFPDTPVIPVKSPASVLVTIQVCGLPVFSKNELPEPFPVTETLLRESKPFIAR